MKHLLQFILLMVHSHGFCSEVEKEKDEAVWTLIEGVEILPWKKEFEVAAKKDRLFEEMKKIGIFSTRGPFFFRNDKKDAVRVLFYIGFVGRYEVELKLLPKVEVSKTFFRDGAKSGKFEKFRPMYDFFIEDLLKDHGIQEEAPNKNQPNKTEKPTPHR